jgi:hypothetical protein
MFGARPLFPAAERPARFILPTLGGERGEAVMMSARDQVVEWDVTQVNISVVVHMNKTVIIHFFIITVPATIHWSLWEAGLKNMLEASHMYTGDKSLQKGLFIHTWNQ